MSTVTAQVISSADIAAGQAATVLSDVAMVSGVATSAASSTAITLTGSVVTPGITNVWRIVNVGSEAVVVLTYTGAHPNPADAAAARAAGGIVLAPNSVEILKYAGSRPNICVINA